MRVRGRSFPLPVRVLLLIALIVPETISPVPAQHFVKNSLHFYSILFLKNDVYIFVSFCPKKDSFNKTGHEDIVTQNLHSKTKNQDADLPRWIT